MTESAKEIASWLRGRGHSPPPLLITVDALLDWFEDEARQAGYESGYDAADELSRAP